MSVFGPVDDGDRRVWQIQAALALVDLLDEAHKQQLEPLHWTVDGLSLKGRVSDPRWTAAEQRSVFDGWVLFLNEASVREHADSFTVHLVALCPDRPRNVEISVIADISLTPGDEP